MKIFRKSRNSTIGLDIGTHTTKVVQISAYDNKTQLDAYTKFLTPKDIFDAGDFSQLLKDMMVKPIHGKFNATSVILDLPHEHTFETLVSLETPRSKDIDLQIKQMLVNQHTLNEKSMAYYQPLQVNNIDTKSQLFSVITAKDTKMGSVIRALQVNGLKFETLRSPIVSTYYQSGIDEDQDKASLYVAIGHTNTSFFIPLKNSFIIQKFLLGSKEFDQIIMQQMCINEDRALQLQNRVGIADTELGHKLRSVLDTQLNNLVESIEQILEQHYEDNRPSQTKIILSGDMASMPGLNDYLKKRLGITTEQINPWRNTSMYPLKPMPKQRNAEYATAIGLALNR